MGEPGRRPGAGRRAATTWIRRRSGPRPTASSTGSPTTSRDVERYAVLPADRARVHRPAVPGRARPTRPEPLDAILADSTAWSSPTRPTGSTRASSPTSRRRASGPGMLGEFLTAALGQNPMLWRTSPIGTELEGVVVGWLRQALGLPDAFDGLLTDTASTSYADRPRRGTRGGGPRRRGGGARGARDELGAAAGLRLRRRPTARSRRRA